MPEMISRLSAAWIRIGTVLSRPTNWRQRSSSRGFIRWKIPTSVVITWDSLHTASLLHGIPSGFPSWEFPTHGMIWYECRECRFRVPSRRRLWWALRHRHMQPSHARLLPVWAEGFGTAYGDRSLPSAPFNLQKFNVTTWESFATPGDSRQLQQCATCQT